MARRVKLNTRGIGEILRSSGMQRVTRQAAEEVAANVRAQRIRVGDQDGGPREVDLPVEVTMSTTDRAHASVTIKHPAGEAVQAKHGALTRAAGEVGLDVNGRK